MTSAAAERGRAVRQRLLAAAVELVAEQGWATVSTRVLAQRAGVTPSVVHYHFPSLQALLQEAVLNAIRRLIDELNAALDAADAPADAVGAMLASADEYTGTDPMSLLFIEAYLAGIRDERFRGEIASVLGEFRMSFGRRLDEVGVPNPDETASIVLAAFDGLILQRGLGMGPNTQAAASVLRRLTATTTKEESE